MIHSFSSTVYGETGGMALGGDLRDGNGQYSKGETYNIKLYRDMRSAEEIVLDASGSSLDESNLIAAYNFESYIGSELPEKIVDLSRNGNDFILKLDQTWITKEPTLFDAGLFAMLLFR